MAEGEQIFITDDKWLLNDNGVIDPDDRVILDAVAKHGKVVKMRSEEAIKKMQEEETAELNIKESPDIDDGFVKLSSEMIKELAKSGNEKSTSYDMFFRIVMRRQIAVRIRGWRIHEHRSWRSVARKAYEHWPEWPRWEPPSNQIVGMSLCKIAAHFLGEDYSLDPWN